MVYLTITIYLDDSVMNKLLRLSLFFPVLASGQVVTMNDEYECRAEFDYELRQNGSVFDDRAISNNDNWSVIPMKGYTIVNLKELLDHDGNCEMVNKNLEAVTTLIGEGQIFCQNGRSHLSIEIKENKFLYVTPYSDMSGVKAIFGTCYKL